MSIFISHASEDNFITKVVEKRLRDVGLAEIWVDYGSIPLGSEWQKEIGKALQNSKVLLVLLSPDSLASQWVKLELEMARHLGLAIIPARVRPYRDGDIPDTVTWLNQLQISPLESDDEKEWTRLIDRIRDLIMDVAIPKLSWKRVPAGEFHMAKGTGQDHIIHIPDFQICERPISNYDFEFFAQSEYNRDKWWTTQGLHWKYDAQIVEPYDNGPENEYRTNLNWYEAVAFCRWLSEMEGQRIRLPTEAEWEKAMSKTRIVSPGIQEWCQTVYSRDYPYPYPDVHQDDGREQLDFEEIHWRAAYLRVIRGGTSNWTDRTGQFAERRDLDVGFRVVKIIE